MALFLVLFAMCVLGNDIPVKWNMRLSLSVLKRMNGLTRSLCHTYHKQSERYSYKTHRWPQLNHNTQILIDPSCSPFVQSKFLLCVCVSFPLVTVPIKAGVCVCVCVLFLLLLDTRVFIMHKDRSCACLSVSSRIIISL